MTNLRTKYDMLLALHQAPAERSARRREALRATAERFPAALREWDVQPPEELARRRAVVVQALAEAAAGHQPVVLADPAETWLPYALHLHPHLRALLRVRRYLVTRERALDAPSTEDLLACAGLGGSPLWSDPPDAARFRQLVGLILRPPGGSLVALAYADVAAHHGVSVAAIKHALFEPRLCGDTARCAQ